MPVVLVDLLRRRHNLTGVPDDEHLQRIAEAEGLEIVDWPFRSALRELYYDGVVGLRSNLTRPWKRWLLAHALTHHLMHVGSQLDMTNLSKRRQERMADLAAGSLLWGCLLHSDCPLSIWQIAEAAEVPPECVVRWRELQDSVSPCGQVAAFVSLS